MATRLSAALQLITDYTQSEENTLAATLSGQPAYSVVLFNTTLAKERYWNGSAFISILDVLSIAQAEIDFGVITQTEYNTSVTIADTNITTGSLITCSLSATATVDHSIDEVMISGVNVIAGNIQNGVGFDILAYCENGTFGKYKINYTIKY